MEEGDAKNPNTEQMEVKEPKHDGTTMRKALLVINCIMLSIGNCGSPIIMRLYFIHGGNRIWFSSWLQTAGCPIILLPITCAYVHRSRTANPTSENKLFCMERPLFVAAIVLGILSGLDNYLYSYGLSRLPVSTSSLIIASQLAFTAGFAFLLVKQKFTAYSVKTPSDRPANESNKEYILGFYKKAKQEISYALVMEIQLVMCLVATGFCTVGMLVNNDFKVIGREAREFELGETKYHVVVVFSAIINQCFFLGAIGVVFCASSLLSAVVIAVLLPVTEILAVFFFNEKFQAEKGVSLALSLWGFISYFYGEIKQSKKKKPDPETEMASSLLPNTLKSSV
ncbi:hypothetical protein ES319_D05G234400v1 [Gossypium barbadense]|uniref:Probable purine permease n=1 Tax=Gossypium barbadense TaxID=3634 RepID=A0A5J5RH63_GOSBA|nr:hypothetical protein ES319_D05G234400v1 [Gossypium barbadense]